MFEDRFTHDNTRLSSLNLDTAQEATVKTISPDLYQMVEMVRNHSVIIKKKTIAEVYHAITNHADPRIALVLAAARDKEGNQLFPSFEVVRQFMFGIESDAEVFANVTFKTREIFVDGIRRVSAALAASVLIAQLAQIDQQANHAKVLEAQALQDLDRILQVPELTGVRSQSTKETDEQAALYFQVFDEFMGSTMTCTVQVYLSGLQQSTWYTSGIYTGTLNTARIAADIADKVNELTLNNRQANLVAGVVLAGGQDLHRVVFAARTRDSVIAAEVISVQIAITDSDNNVYIEMPFKWGVNKTELAKFNVNSLLVKVINGKLTGLILRQDEELQPLTVLYIRRARQRDDAGNIMTQDGRVISALTNYDVVWRISPTMNENAVFTLEYKVSNTPGDVIEQSRLDENRPAQLGLRILDEMFAIKSDIKALGTIIRNDPPTSIDPMVGIQLVAWTVTNPEAWIIYDLIDFPPDLEVALGNLVQPMTEFSNKPRSLRVETKYDNAYGDLANADTAAKLVELPRSPLLQRFKDLREKEYYSKGVIPFTHKKYLR